MLSWVLTAALHAADVAAAEVPDDPHPHWLPVQGNVSALGLLDPAAATTLGVSMYVGFAWGWPHVERPVASTHEGLFLGVGGHGFLGATDLPDCPSARRCASRRYGGLALRVGYAFFDKKPDRALPAWLWPDTYVYVQLAGFAGREELAPAPLSPGSSSVMYGARLDVGLTAPALSRALFWLANEFMGNMQNGQSIALGVLLFPLALLEHFELDFELSNGALSPGGFRFGLSAGSGF